jgi:hypothetical protein
MRYAPPTASGNCLRNHLIPIRAHVPQNPLQVSTEIYALSIAQNLGVVRMTAIRRCSRYIFGSQRFGIQLKGGSLVAFIDDYRLHQGGCWFSIPRNGLYFTFLNASIAACYSAGGPEITRSERTPPFGETVSSSSSFPSMCDGHAYFA